MSDHCNRRNPARLLLTGCTAIGWVLISACAATPERTATVSEQPAEAQEGWTGIEGVTQAIARLNAGDPEGARARLVSVLKHQPSDTIARRLLDQIDQDPKSLLGAENFSYKAQSGDSFSTLASRFLGDPMLFYALARYNGFTVPADPVPGRSLLIPGKAPAAARKEPARPSPDKKPATTAAKPEPKPAAPAGDPARASRLRGMALAAMNSGAIDKAVTLLRQAHQANPADARIKSDLDRALRVQSTVRSR